MHEIRDVGDEIAHDLRTPLTRVRARLERARDGAATREELVEAADRAIAGIDQTLAIITALLRIAEIEHRERRVSFREIDLAEVVREAAELYEPIAEEKGLTLATEAGSVPVYGDRDLLLEATVNLVDNAVKFTPAGGKVWLSALKTPGGPVLRVADTGPGIEESEREAVLRRFYRTDKSRHTDGTGLGLSLVAAIARMHGFSLNIRGGDPGCVVELGCATAAPLG
jgi:signal transduction histidine kinase